MTPTGMERWNTEFERDRRPRDVRLREIQAVIESGECDRPRTCPECDGCQVVGHGRTSKGTQRYRCKECGSTFVSPGVVSGSRMSRAQWMTLAQCIVDGDTAKRSAERCGVSVATVYRNRKKLRQMMEDRVPEDAASPGYAVACARAYRWPGSGRGKPSPVRHHEHG